jgi:protein phosphatase
MVPEGRISEILADSQGDPEPTARRLLSAALDAGGTDNVTVVVVDLKEQAQPEESSGDTHEMPAVGQSEGTATRPSRPPERGRKADASRRSRAAARRKRKGGGFGRFVRGLAIALVIVAALTPAYLWGSSRYFLGVDDAGEVVAYRGLPYAPLGIELNDEWRETEVQISEVKTPYRGPIENHRLYTQDEIEPVMRDLGR